MTCQQEIFIKYRTLNPPEQVIIGDGCSIDAIGIRRAEINVYIGENEYIHSILQEVYHIPDLNVNLLSVSHLMKQGLEVTFDGFQCKILAKGKTVALAHKQTSLYVLRVKP
ncbi:hypothetical protein C8R48DRAFT_600308, partial [Suillus tomentosus]